MEESFDLELRVPVWEALSELLIREHLTAYDYSWVAEKLKQSSYSVAELEKILFEEVMPVFRRMSFLFALSDFDELAPGFVTYKVLEYGFRDKSGLRGVWLRYWASRKLPGAVGERWQRVKAALR